MGRPFRLWATACVCAIVAVPAFAQQQVAAGHVKVASGEAVIIRAGDTVPVTTGIAVYQADLLRTGKDGRVGLLVRDDTQVSIGPQREVRLDSFMYEPAEGQLSLALNFIRGIAVYVSGRIAKLAPDAVRLETPASIIGVRGTTLALQVASE
jgi:hypothetical protein